MRVLVVLVVVVVRLLLYLDTVVAQPDYNLIDPLTPVRACKKLGQDFQNCLTENETGKIHANYSATPQSHASVLYTCS